LVFEEWYFMTSESWIFSKTRKAFDAMVEVGGSALQLTSRVFDRVVRRTLRKGENEPQTPGKRVKALAKWVAVGGPAILNLVEPISAAVATAASGYFILLDPPAQ
jgi:hypothetical protein